MRKRTILTGILAAAMTISSVLPGQAAEGTVYPPSFTASGTEVEEYNKNLEHFEQQFHDYFAGTDELAKVEGYEEPVSVSTVNWYTAQIEDAISKMGSKYGESLDANRWTDAMKRLYNIDVTYNWWAQDGDYDQKLRLDMASGDLPDVFLVRKQSDLMDLARQGLIWDLTDLIEEYGSEYDKEVWQSDEGAAMQMATLDGAVYGLPSIQSATDAVSYLWIRDDWMNKLGLANPETLADLKDVMTAFVEQDPDGNGADDTWGLYLYGQDLEYPLKGIYAAYGSYPKTWYEKEDGTVIYGGVDENTKNALAYIADLYQSGLIDPEFVAMDATKANEAVLNDKVGVVFAGHWFGHTAGDLHELNPESNWRCVPLPVVEKGDTVMSILKPTMQGWVAVNKEFSHPEIALKMRSLTTYGLLCEESAWWWYDENVSWNISPVRCNVSAFDNLNTYLNLQEAYENGNDESLLRAKGVPYWANLHGDQAWEWELMFGPGENTAFAMMKDIYDKDSIFWDSFHSEQNEQMQNNWSTIEDEQLQAYTNIIIGKTGAEDGFAAWIDTWKDLGGDEITAYVNECCGTNE